MFHVSRKRHLQNLKIVFPVTTVCLEDYPEFDYTIYIM